MNRIDEFEKAYRWMCSEIELPTFPELVGYFKKCIENLKEEPLIIEDKNMTISMEWGIKYLDSIGMPCACVNYIADCNGREWFGCIPVVEMIEMPRRVDPRSERLLCSLERVEHRVREEIHLDERGV